MIFGQSCGSIASMTEEGVSHKKSGGFGAVLLAVLLAVVIAGAGGTYYFYSQYQEAKRQLKEASSTGQNQVQELVSEVGKLMELPTDETPTLATIKNTENFAEHPFLSKGQADDKLLIYPQSKMVIMYRPSSKKIVAVGTVTMQQTEPGASEEPTPTPEPSPTPEPASPSQGGPTPAPEASPAE